MSELEKYEFSSCGDGCDIKEYYLCTDVDPVIAELLQHVEGGVILLQEANKNMIAKDKRIAELEKERAESDVWEEHYNLLLENDDLIRQVAELTAAIDSLYQAAPSNLTQL